MTRRTKAFLSITFVIAIIDVCFVLGNIHFSNKALQNSLQKEAQQLEAAYQMLLDQTYTNMLALATFIANDTLVQSLFYAGKKAVESEGGGAGGEKATAIRNQLEDILGHNWVEMQSEYMVRQLHFQFGPGATSFLRVHAPDKFGDDLSDIRFIINETNKDHQKHAGFETGRVYSGLRGVVPVSAYDAETEEEVHVGALEVGTSFDVLVDILDSRLRQGVGVVLNKNHVRTSMWQEYVVERFTSGFLPCGCVIEASSRSGLDDLLSINGVLPVGIKGLQAKIVELEGIPYVVSFFPIRDYLGERVPKREDVGYVLFWHEAIELVQDHTNGIVFNVLFGIGGFVLIELIILFVFRVSMGQLEEEVKLQTVELEEQAEQLRLLSETDGLTGLSNRLHIDKTIHRELSRHDRYKRPLSIVMFDLDHFKSVNDTYGHQVGDELLKSIAELVAGNVRKVDDAGRWGGEEFLIVCPDTELGGAEQLAEKLRAAIAGFPFPTVGNKTASFGVAQLREDESFLELTNRTDQALYIAKANGRNCVEVAS